MNTMMKVKVFIDKWTDAEVDLRTLREQLLDIDQIKKMDQIEASLEVLYIACLELVSKIYRSGKTRRGRAGMFYISILSLLYSHYPRSNLGL